MKKQPLWPWTVRAFAIALPFLYALAMNGNAFNPTYNVLPGVLFLSGVALVTCAWYRWRGFRDDRQAAPNLAVDYQCGRLGATCGVPRRHPAVSSG